MFSKSLLVAFTTVVFALSAQAAPRPAKGVPQPKSQPISSAAAPPASSCPPATTVTVTASSAATAAATSSADKAASTSTAAAGGSSGAATNGTATAGGDPQNSLTLDPKVIATGFASDGQQTPTAGQVASLTSTNNFINFCLTVPNLPITNGQQIVDGSCNPAPMGVIAAKANMPSSKFVFPTNFDVIKSNTAFTVQMAINHLQTGNFVNAQANYYAAPQQVNGAGDIIGHTHVVMEQLTDFKQTTPNQPAIFAFFKGVNGKAVNGVVTADVTAGLPAGFYRLASINAASNHQPVLVAVAQHGSLDDMVYFQVTDDGTAANSTSTGTGSGAASTSVVATGGAAQTSAAATAASSSAAGTVTAGAPAQSTTAASNNGKGGNNNGNNNGNNGNKGGNNGNNNGKGGNQQQPPKNQHCFFNNQFCLPF